MKNSRENRNIVCKSKLKNTRSLWKSNFFAIFLQKDSLDICKIDFRCRVILLWFPKFITDQFLVDAFEKKDTLNESSTFWTEVVKYFFWLKNKSMA